MYKRKTEGGKPAKIKDANDVRQNKPKTDRDTNRKRFKPGRKVPVAAPIVEKTYEDLQLKNMRLQKEIMLEIAEVRTIKLD